MGEIKVSRWECDSCGHVYEVLAKYQECMARHLSEKKITTPDGTVTVGIPRTGQSMMGGSIEFEGYDWTTGKVIANRKTENGPEALIEIGEERKWVSGYILTDWEKQKQREEYRAAHPVDYSAMSGQTVIIGNGGNR